MNMPLVKLKCSVSKSFPPISVLKGFEPSPVKDRKEFDLHQKWKRLCGKTRMGEGCEKCMNFQIMWDK